MTNTCSTQCGLFDFMANEIGIKVLHPGGYKATKELCSQCSIEESSQALDLACGVGTTSFFIEGRYNCNVTGVDIAENLIDIAKKSLSEKGKEDKITFKVANALDLPYPDHSFDTVIAQAFFILIDEKEKALEEISRVLKPGGNFGSLELSWFSTPTEEAYAELKSKTCSDFIPRVKTFDAWESFFQSTDLKHISTAQKQMDSGMMKMIKSEGLASFFKVILKMIGNSKRRNKMMDVQGAFRKYQNELGYGIYHYKKI